MANVYDKLDGVKSIMHQNIEITLKNSEQMENLVKASSDLNDQAIIFNSSSKNLKRELCVKQFKMRLLLTFLILSILGMIITPIVVITSK
jgi:uncharacterized tellurite resistance protein B-like protein